MAWWQFPKPKQPLGHEVLQAAIFEALNESRTVAEKPTEEIRTLNRFTEASVVSILNLNPPFRKNASVEFRCLMSQEGPYGLPKVVKTEFKTGMGPCGRFVIGLSIAVGPDLMRIVQVSIPEDITEKREEFKAGAEKHRKEAIAVKKHGFSHGVIQTPTRKDYEHHLVYLENLAEEIHRMAGKREIKEFVYKMADIQGRIVTTQ